MISREVYDWMTTTMKTPLSVSLEWQKIIDYYRRENASSDTRPLLADSAK
jgi:hypothetical protein